MITVQQAKDSLDSLYEGVMMTTTAQEAFFTLEEFIKQYEDLVKVKKVTRGALLDGDQNAAG